MGRIEVNHSLYYILINAIIKYKQADGIVCQSTESFESSGIYFDVDLYNTRSKSAKPEHSPFLNKDQVLRPLPRALTNKLIRAHGSTNFFRLVDNLAKMKVVQSQQKEIIELCFGIPSTLAVGPSNIGKTYVYMSAFHMIGIRSVDSAVFKFKDMTAAGLRQNKNVYPNQLHLSEDSHVGGNKRNHSVKEILFSVFSGDQDLVASLNNSGGNNIMFVQTMNICVINQKEIKEEDAMRRCRLEIFLPSDNDEECKTAEMVYI